MIAVGCFFEGETFLILGGFVAHRGYLSLEGVIVCALIGSIAGDQLYFFLGRWRSASILARRPGWKPHLAKVNSLLDRRPVAVIFGSRFLYGLRTVTPFVIGMSRIPVWEFMVLNLLGAALWAVAVGSAGYFFGAALTSELGQIKHYEHLIMGAIVTAGALFWIINYGRARAGRHREGTGEDAK